MAKPTKVLDKMDWPIIRIIFLAPPEWEKKLECLVIQHNTNRTAFVKSLIDKAICEAQI